VGVTIIYSLTELPPDPLEMFAVKDIDEAKKIATEYQASWLYKDKLLFCLEKK